MKSAYPVIFYEDEESVGVIVPDIKSCFTFGDDMADAIDMAEDVIEMTLVGYEDDDKEIPRPSTITQIEEKIRNNEVEIFGSNPEVSYVRIDTDKWRESVNQKSVRKSVTIPEWLNKKAEKANVNFSQLLQNAIRQYLNIA